MKTELTCQEKLQAISDARYLGGQNWTPKKGDYYTLIRNDLQLYQIIDEDSENLYTIYCHVPDSPISKWLKTEFLRGFGENRIYVGDYIISGSSKTE